MSYNDDGMGLSGNIIILSKQAKEELRKQHQQTEQAKSKTESEAMGQQGTRTRDRVLSC